MDSSLHRLNPQSSRLPFRRPGSVSVAIWPSLASFCTTKNRVAVADSTPNDGEAPVIVGMADAAMHMYSAAIDTLPDAHDPEFRTAPASSSPGSANSRAHRRRRRAVAGSPVGDRRAQWCAAPLRRAMGPGPATLGSGCTSPWAQAVDHGDRLRKDLIEAVEAEEPPPKTRRPDQGPDRRARRLMPRSSSRASVKP